MSWYEVHEFSNNIRKTAAFLREMAISESNNLDPFAWAANHVDFTLISGIISNIDADLSNLYRATKIMDRELADFIISAYMRSEFGNTLNRLRVRIESSSWTKSSRNSMLRFTLKFISHLPLPLYLFPNKKRSYFNQENIDMEYLISATDRLGNVAQSVSNRLFNLESDEIGIRPSSIKIEHIEFLLEKAAEMLENLTLDSTTRSDVQTLLTSARTELASNTPSWSKIVGALAIALTLLGGASAVVGGIADAPEAVKNIKSAVEYILGFSKKTRSDLPDQIPHLPFFDFA